MILKCCELETGDYLTFGALVVKFGGWEWPPAREGALRQALKCAKMGGDWTFMDEDSGLQKFFALEHSWGVELQR